MSDQLLPQQAARPWLPADNVRELRILNRYNIPLTGLIEQDGVIYLYACLLGELEDLNIWAYAPLRDAELQRLTSLTDDDLNAAIDQVLTGRTLVVALAAEYRLADWVPVETAAEEPLAIAARFVTLMQARRQRIDKEVEGLERQHERELAGR